jgi:multimeric flavodoxin WrbA
MFQVSAQTKMLIDRLFALLNPDYSPRFPKGLPIGLAYTQMESNAEAFRGYFDLNEKLFGDMGFQVAATIVASGTSEKGDIAKQTALLERAKDIGRTLMR